MAKLVTNGSFYVVAAAEMGARPEMVYWDECPANFQFCSGKDGEEVYHIVYNTRNTTSSKYSKTPYLCVVSHKKNSTYPSDDVKNNGANAKWSAFSNMALIATDIMLARKILAGEIDVESLTVNKLSTAGKNSHIEIEDGIMKVYGTSDSPNIVFGVDDNGQAILTYYNNNGVKLYDLGPSGISKIDVVEAKWTEVYVGKLNTTGTDKDSMLVSAFNNMSRWSFIEAKVINEEKYYKYTAKRVQGVIDPDTAQYDGVLYTGRSFYESTIPVGWYILKQSASMYYNPLKGDEYIEPDDMSVYNPHIKTDEYNYIYSRNMIYYNSSGKQGGIQSAYFNEEIDKAISGEK